MISEHQIHNFYDLCKLDKARALTIGKLGIQIKKMLDESAKEAGKEAQTHQLEMFRLIEGINYDELKTALVRYCDRQTSERAKSFTALVAELKDSVKSYEVQKSLRLLEEHWGKLKTINFGRKSAAAKFAEWFNTAFAPINLTAEAAGQREVRWSAAKSHEAMQLYPAYMDKVSRRSGNDLAKAKLRELEAFLDAQFEVYEACSV